MAGFIIALIVIFILAIILYARDTDSDKKRESPSLKILPPRTGSEASEHTLEVANFFGRKDELSAIEELLKEKNCITIYGDPGVGKTTLAAQFTKRLTAGKIFWHTCDERSRLEGLLSRLNGLLKENNDRYFEPVLVDYLMGVKEKIRLLARRLEGKNLSLFIDQVERIKDERLRMALGWLSENLRSTRLILITSGEIDRTHPDERGLIGIGPFKADEIERLGLDLDSEALQAITERIGSRPLELRLLDGLLNFHYPLENMSRIKGWQDLLNETIQMLRDDEITLLRQIAAANEPLPQEGIRNLSRRIDLADILSSLVNSGLLMREKDFYFLHSRIKESLYPQLVNKQQTHRTLGHYYLDLSKLKPFISLILEASHHLNLAGEFDLSLSTLLSESRRMIKDGYAPVLLEHLAAYERQKISPKNWIRIAGLKGDIFKAIGSLDEAKEAYEEMLKSSRLVNSHQGMGSAYNNLGSIYQARQEWNLAIDYYERGLEVLREMETVRRRSGPQNVGWVYRGKGRWNEAVRYYLGYYEKNLKANREKGDLVGQANSLSNLGSAFSAQADWNRAIDYYNKCLEILRQLDDPIAEAVCYDNLGSIYSAKGDPDRAISYYEKGLEIFERLDDLAHDARSLSSLAEVYCEKRDYERSISYYERSLDKLREIGDLPGEARSLIRFAKVLKEKGDLKYAADCLTKSERIFEQLEGGVKEAAFYETAAALYQTQGDITQAIDCLKSGLGILTREGNVKDGYNLSNSLGALLIGQGRLDEAASYVSRALEIGEALGDKDLQVQSLKLFASLFKRRGDEQRCILYLEKAKGLESGGE